MGAACSCERIVLSESISCVYSDNLDGLHSVINGHEKLKPGRPEQRATYDSDWANPQVPLDEVSVRAIPHDLVEEGVEELAQKHYMSHLDSCEESEEMERNFPLVENLCVEIWTAEGSMETCWKCDEPGMNELGLRDEGHSASDNDEENLVPMAAVELLGGAVYSGQWNVRGQKHGSGRLDMPDSSFFVGQFFCDVKRGNGTYHYANNSMYEGQWENDVQHGYGIERWVDESTFSGNFCKGQKDGRGEFEWASGCRYTGFFKANQMNGEGEYRWKDGRVYKGQWTKNNLGPHGVMTWPDGRVYEGQFKRGKKEGDGTLKWADGREYRGPWVDGRQHGHGITVSAAGVARSSEWRGGKFVQWLDMSSASPFQADAK